MLRELRKKVDEFHMVSPGDCILAGVSGGADSVCLLLALVELKKNLDFRLEVVHVEHGIRGAESRQDAAFVQELCKRYEIICHERNVDVPAYCEKTGLGVEEAARILRYQVFAKLALEKNAKVALAHHMEDNAETILFQMVRGSSLTGVCGMQPVRQDENGVCYIRPLLFFHRSEVEAFLESQKMAWCVDSTNSELEYSRNFIRQRIIPELEKINTQAVAHINQTALHLSDVKDYLDYETEQAWNRLVVQKDILEIDGMHLLELHPVLQREIAYRAIVCVAGRKKDITATHVADLLALCEGQSGKKISLPYDIVAWKSFATVYVTVEQREERIDAEFEVIYEVSQETLNTLWNNKAESEILIGESGDMLRFRVFERSEETLEIPRKPYTKWFDYDKIKKGFCIRTRRSGDYFISDESGHRKKLKTYFIEEKIPVTERAKRWLLAQDNEVLWLIGGRMSEHIKVSQKTRYIFEITYDGGNKDE